MFECSIFIILISNSITLAHNSLDRPIDRIGQFQLFFLLEEEEKEWTLYVLFQMIGHYTNSEVDMCVMYNMLLPIIMLIAMYKHSMTRVRFDKQLC